MSLAINIMEFFRRAHTLISDKVHNIIQCYNYTSSDSGFFFNNNIYSEIEKRIACFRKLEPTFSLFLATDFTPLNRP